MTPFQYGILFVLAVGEFWTIYYILRHFSKDRNPPTPEAINTVMDRVTQVVEGLKEEESARLQDSPCHQLVESALVRMKDLRAELHKLNESTEMVG